MKEVIKELYPEDYVLSIELFKKKRILSIKYDDS